MTWNAKKIIFLIYRAPRTIVKLAIWLIGIITVVTVLEFFIVTTLLEGRFEARWLQKGLALLIMLVFVSVATITQSVISKIEYIKYYCTKNNITESQFFSRNTLEIQKQWLG